MGFYIIVVSFSRLNERELDLRLYDSFSARISSDGSVLWSFKAVFKTSCTLQLRQFPWDTQVCKLTMGSWVYDIRYVRVKVCEVWIHPT